MKLKVRFFPAVLSGFLLLSCSTVNLDEVNSKLESLDKRVGNAETKLGSLNGDITKVADLIDAVGRRLFITDIDNTSGSLALTFSDGRTVFIQTGADGKKAPVIGVGRDADNVYYWTITLDGKTEWLKDENGNKMPVNGRNGIDGKDGKDGKDGIGSSPSVGKDGKDGIDGITPVVSIDGEGFWIVSYDSGNTFVRIRDYYGRDISAMPYIEGGSYGYLFSGFKENDETVEIILVNGEVLEFEKFRELAIHFPQTENVLLRDDITVLGFSLEGLDVTSHLETVDVGNIASHIEMVTETTGYLNVLPTGNWLYGSKVIVLLTNSRHTVTTVITLVREDDRIEKEIGSNIVQKFVEYIPIQKEYTELDISGSYLVKPCTCEFSSTKAVKGYATGDDMPAKYIRFGKTDKYSNVTVEYMNEDGSLHYNMEEFHIAAQGSRFTVFAKLSSRAMKINKTSIIQTVDIVISGEKTAEGIRNFKFGEYLEQKTYDPGPYLIPERQYYIQSCGLVEYAQWPEN